VAKVTDIVFLHGWGLNSGIWTSYIEQLEAEFTGLEFHCLDISGYGREAHQISSSNVSVLANECLQRAPDKALWVAWSLGGLIAMQAALTDKANQIQALQLINTTPKFVQSADWLSGVDIEVFQRFCDALADDYQRSLATFLLIQTGANEGARQLARVAQDAICAYSNPSQATLQAGIDCLANTDLRARLTAFKTPSQVVSGRLDRVTNPAGSKILAEMLGADLVEINSGHAPFLTHPLEMQSAFAGFLKRINSVVE